MSLVTIEVRPECDRITFLAAPDADCRASRARHWPTDAPKVVIWGCSAPCTAARSSEQADMGNPGLDGDFASALNSDVIDRYLHSEWKSKKKWGDVTLYRSLSSFFKSRFPAVELSVEYEKDELIQRLNGSPNFSETHKLIANLYQFETFTKGQIRCLFSALLMNNQVSWIATDPDVRAFYRKFKDNAWHLGLETTSQAETLLELEDGYFAPF
jgi:hypothetical protein